MSLLDLALLCMRLGFLSFGGGVTVLAEMQREVVDLRGAMTVQEFSTAYALSQATPGPQMLYLIPLGFKVAGAMGALVALLTFVVPPMALTAFVAGQWGKLSALPWVRSVNRTLAALSVGLFAAGLHTVAAPLIGEPVSVAAACIGAGAMLAFGLSPTVIVLTAAALGLFGLL